MTPFGHASVSYIISNKILCFYPVFIISGGIVPDIDFIAYLFNNLNGFHRTITHSVVFIALLSGMVLLTTNNNRCKSLSFLLGGVIHILIDSILDGNHSNGVGTQMFWPLSDEFYSPFSLLKDNSNVSWHNPLELIRKNILIILLIEIPFYYLAYRVYVKRK